MVCVAEIQALRASASLLEKAAQEFEAAITQSRSIEQVLEDAWEGTARDVFCSKQREQLAWKTQWIQFIYMYVERMNKTADQYESVDQDGQTLIAKC